MIVYEERLAAEQEAQEAAEREEQEEADAIAAAHAESRRIHEETFGVRVP